MYMFVTRRNIIFVIYVYFMKLEVIEAREITIKLYFLTNNFYGL